MRTDLFDVRMHIGIDILMDRAHFSAEIIDRYRYPRGRQHAKSPDFRTYDDMMEWISDTVTEFLEPIEALLPESVVTGRIGL